MWIPAMTDYLVGENSVRGIALGSCIVTVFPINMVKTVFKKNLKINRNKIQKHQIIIFI